MLSGINLGPQVKEVVKPVKVESVDKQRAKFLSAVSLSERNTELLDFVTNALRA